MNDKKIIGNAEYAWLVDVGIKKVPARIDTGARTSAIWASHVKETPKGLQFVLFAKQSPYFTGVIHTETRYTKIAVASSTGHVQVRYRVPMTIQLRGRRIKTYCTLADRASQAYPLLVGRNTLRGKFVVDVQKGSTVLGRLDDQKVKELEQVVVKNERIL